MPRRRKDCPLCGKQSLVKLSNHLADVHQLSREKRQPYLTQARLNALENDRQKPVAKVEITIESMDERNS